MFMNLDEKLLHTVTHYKRSSTKDAFGQYTYAIASTNSTLYCLVSGRTSRKHTDSQPQSSVHTSTYSVTVKGASAVVLGDELRNAKDYEGNVIFSRGEVIGISPAIHKYEGTIVKDLEVAEVHG